MSRFQTFSSDQIDLLRKGGRILSICLQELASRVREGMETRELDAFAEEFIRSHDGAVPAFKGYHGFPASLCVSVNDECVHGIPGNRRLARGDIVALDCGVIYGALYTDACLTAVVGETTPAVENFLSMTRSALDAACALVAPGRRIGDLSSAIQSTVTKAGFSCVHSLTGHGLGTELHQFPDIPNEGEANTGPSLPPYTLIAIEPITAMGGPSIRDGGDGWTICTADGSLSAHYEHTVLVLPGGHEIIA